TVGSPFILPSLHTFSLTTPLSPLHSLPSLPAAGFGGRRSESSPPAPLPGRNSKKELSLKLSL
ncbi:MAG: hypothetical protein K2I51_03660, partial [Muribaculaceae bacterium]|nr:hypothetical protein [Muribaculaceae bacterium]